MKKRLVAAAAMLALLLAWIGPVNAAAAAVTGQRASTREAAAQALYDMGLFKGTGDPADEIPTFDLESKATRGQAIVMLVRLLGAEEEALEAAYAHPFTDADWADPYIGYAYRMGISDGISDTAFGTDDEIGANQFVTLVLRALGYTVADWSDPYSLADAVGLEYSADTLLRGNMAYICYSALFCPVNGTQKSLYRTLVDGGVVDGPCAGWELAPSSPLVTSVRAQSLEELAAGLASICAGRAMGEAYIAIPAGQEQAYKDFLYRESFHVCGELIGLSYYAGDGGIWFTGKYNMAVTIIAYLEGKLAQLPEGNYAAVLEKAMEIVETEVDQSMSDYQKVKALHDYLGNHTSYGSAPQAENTHSAAGPLLDGKGVCSGYTDAFHLLCYLAGIECIQVGGTAVSGGETENHIWNKVKVDGQWYNVDVTYDDPTYIGVSMNLLIYDYFLISDEALDRDHDWGSAYYALPASPADYTP